MKSVTISVVGLLASPILAMPLVNSTIQIVGKVADVGFSDMFNVETASTAVLAACTGTNLSGEMFYVDEDESNVGECFNVQASFNDLIESVETWGNTINFYENSNCGGSSITVTGTDNDLGSFNNQISSWMMTAYNP